MRFLRRTKPISRSFKECERSVKAVLGVDGGNTKTDYLLHDMDGRLLCHLRAGTCSHEAIGMAGAYTEMDARLRALLDQAGVAKEDIAGAAFGLAGVDQRVQQQALTDIVHRLGFMNSIVMNDSFLGIKAGNERGIGICSINGTGSTSGGIDATGKWVQIGGLGATPCGDGAGGEHIALTTIGAVYRAIYRFGEPTALTDQMLHLFDCEAEDFHTVMSIKYQTERQIASADIVKLLFAVCDAGDPVATDIVDKTANALANGAAGCAVRLRFENPIPLVLIGSVWTRGRHQRMIDQFLARFEALSGMRGEIHILETPPAAGSVLWALELALGGPPDRAIRQRVLLDTKGL